VTPDLLLEKLFPEDTCVKFTYLPVDGALLALNQRDTAGAIETLRAAVRYDLAVPCSGFGYFGNVYDLRTGAYRESSGTRQAPRHGDAQTEGPWVRLRPCNSAGRSRREATRL
jgi:hypothetical protein